MLSKTVRKWFCVYCVLSVLCFVQNLIQVIGSKSTERRESLFREMATSVLTDLIVNSI